MVIAQEDQAKAKVLAVDRRHLVVKMVVKMVVAVAAVALAAAAVATVAVAAVALAAIQAVDLVDKEIMVELLVIHRVDRAKVKAVKCQERLLNNMLLTAAINTEEMAKINSKLLTTMNIAFGFFS